MKICKKTGFQLRVVFSNTISQNKKQKLKKLREYWKTLHNLVLLVGFLIFRVLVCQLVGQKNQKKGTSFFRVQDRDYSSLQKCRGKMWENYSHIKLLMVITCVGKCPVLRILIIITFWLTVGDYTFNSWVMFKFSETFISPCHGISCQKWKLDSY